MGVRLILEEFGITIGKSLSVAIPSLDMDAISSSISLLQISHPMDYSFGIVSVEGKQRIRSMKLIMDVEELQRKICTGELMITERQFRLNDQVKRKIRNLLPHVEAPEHAQFTNRQWFCFLGFYNIIYKRLNRSTLIEVLMKNYPDCLPYIDIAEEAIKEIEFTSNYYI